MKKLLTLFLMLCFLLGLAWALPGHQVAAQTAGNNTVGVFKTYEVAPGAALTLPVEVKGAQQLYGIDLLLEFDPTLLQVVDAEKNTPGVQVALGTFLDPGLMLFNEVDNTAGTISFAMSQVNPSEAKNGNGVLLVVTFNGLKVGVSDLKVTKLDMSTREGVAISGTAADSQVTVKVGAAAQGTVTIPTQAASGAITVPTMAPTQVPTATPQPTATALPTKALMPTATAELAKPLVATQAPAQPAHTDEKPGISITLIIAIVIGIILVAAAVLLLTRNKSDPQGGKRNHREN